MQVRCPLFLQPQPNLFPVDTASLVQIRIFGLILAISSRGALVYAGELLKGGRSAQLGFVVSNLSSDPSPIASRSLDHRRQYRNETSSPSVPRLTNLPPYGAATLTTHYHELDRPSQRSKGTVEEQEHSRETDITTITKFPLLS